MIRLTCIRHAHAKKIGGDENHRNWPISQEGRACGEMLRENLGSPLFSLVFHSSLVRTKQTALVVAGLPNNWGRSIEIPTLFELDDPAENQKMGKMFGELGHDSLLKYQEHCDWNKLEFSGLKAWFDIVKVLEEQFASSKHEGNILVVGHGVLLPAMVYTAVLSNQKNLVLKAQPLMECEGFVLNLELLPQDDENPAIVHIEKQIRV